MNPAPGQIYAVLTGDIVDSSSLPASDRERLYDTLRAAAEQFRAAFPTAASRPVDVFRGDSWQLLMETPHEALRAALFIRAWLRSGAGGPMMDTRISVAVGTVDFVPDDRISGGDGEAFRFSGRGLEIMGHRRCLAFAGGKPENREAIDTIVHLVDTLICAWTDRQALAVSGALRGWKQERIAELWPETVTQQTVGRHLERAGWAAISHALQFMERVVE